MNLPYAVEYVMKKIMNAGGQAYLVGGALRDRLLGITVTDYDIATSLTPDQIENLFSEEKTWSGGKRFGTITVAVGGQNIEVTTFRKESLYSDSRHPDQITFVSDIFADLSRRDFTVNAMAYNPFIADGLVDPFGGRRDLEQHIIRTVGSPYERFAEDPLRIMRGIRFCAQLDFSLDEETTKAMKDCSNQLLKVSSERIRSELDKLLLSPHHHKGLMLMQETEIIGILFAVRNTITGVLTKPGRLTANGIQAMKAIEPNLSYRLAALIVILYPKDFTAQENSDAVKEIMSNLRYDNKTMRHVISLLQGYSGFSAMEVSPFTMRRLLGNMGAEDARQIIKWYNAMQNALNNDAADNPASYNDSANNDDAASNKARTASALLDEILQNNDPVLPSQLAVNGNDIHKLGIGTNDQRIIGEALKLAYQWVLEDPARNNAAYLLDRIRNHYSDNKGK
ncbi:MAG TPA: hypothetical protein GX505_10885 [Clostridiales bacterium]|nr:hypothetical protein [Clostridiales bacterium]